VTRREVNLFGFLRVVDTFNTWLGRIGGWVFFPLTVIIFLDVVLRYIFNSPTIWAWDVNVQLMGALVALGGGYTLLHGGHVCVDILIANLAKRKKAMIDAVTTIFAIFGLLILSWRVGIYTWMAIETQEHFSSTWFPPIYPLKIVIAIGVVALLFQAIANLMRLIMVITAEGER